MKCVACNRNESGIRYGCNDCVNRVTRQLRELGTYWTMLPALVTPVRGAGGRGAPGFGSKAPARDDVLTALDARSLPGGEATTLNPERQFSWVRSIPLAIAGLVEAIAAERGHTGQVGAFKLGYLLDSVPFMAEQHWFDDFTDDIAELHRETRALAGDSPTSLGACLTLDCGGTVWWRQVWRDQKRISLGVCAVCSREYDGLDLVRLGAAQEQAA